MALFTADANTNYLRIFNVAGRRRKAPVQSIRLLPFPDTKKEKEVNHAEFSPDGLYLSVARNDNEVHVYDARFLDNGVLRRFRHVNEVGSFCFGAVQSTWILTEHGVPRLGLLTGGSDGAVRLWDMGLASEDRLNNGKVIAQAKNGVGKFLYSPMGSGKSALIV